MKPNFFLVLLTLLAFGAQLRAEDWTDHRWHRLQGREGPEKPSPTPVHDCLSRREGPWFRSSYCRTICKSDLTTILSRPQAAAEERIKNDASNFKALSDERAQASELEKKVQAEQNRATASSEGLYEGPS